MSIIIRPLEKSDLERGFFDVLVNLTAVGAIAEDSSRWEDLYKVNTSQKRILVAYDRESHQIVGTASIFIETKFIHDGACVGHIEDVVVDDAYRRQGIGKRLVQGCIDIAREQECYKVILDCSSERIGFYESLGFRCECECMRLDL
jgi:glucosamine-phosphate N-acetyltransferase